MEANINPGLHNLLTPLASLYQDPKNARLHDERSVEAIATSLREYGQQKPIVAMEDGKVIAGNGTLAAARKMGWAHLAVVRFTDEVKARAFALADNRTAELSTWDNRELALALDDLAKRDIAADLVGFAPAEAQKLLALLQPLPTTPETENVEPSEKAGTPPEGAEASHVRMVQLFLNDQNQPLFMERCKVLAAKYGTTSVTDTVLRAVEEEHGRHGAKA